MKGLLLTPLISLAAILLQSADARYIFEIEVLSYSNRNNGDWDGGCCDPFCGTCDVYFTFCVREYQYTPRISTIPCTYGVASTARRPITTSFRTFTVGQDIVTGVSNPLRFTGNTWPGAFQFHVKVDDSDPDSDDLLDRVIVDLRLPISSSFTAVSQLGFYRVVTMQFRFRAMCQTNYHRSDCSVFCAPQDSDTLGHYTCGSDGGRVCRSGYSGVDCLTSVCATGCQGTCSRPGLCDRCNQGYTGPLCSVCSELAPGCIAEHAFCVVPGECRCNPGYSGTECHIDEDVCGHRSPCQNEGTCTNTGPEAYVCTCPMFYTGTDCEVEVNLCVPSPCLNGAACERSFGSFRCICEPGWMGETCNIEIDECNAAVSPCQNGGSCTECLPTLLPALPQGTSPVQDTCPLGYTCECQPGFFGDDCETDQDYCLSSPCQNDGTCHDIMGGPGYTCSCPAGYSGLNCDEDIDECTQDICENGGSCTNLMGSFTCSCPPGYTGNRCETDVDECGSSPCRAPNTVRCEDRVNGYSCVCIPGYTGENCEDIINMCEPSPCVNGGTCSPSLNDFMCECPTEFGGPECNIDIVNDCHPDLCLFGGTCVDQVNDYLCQCPPERSGWQCEIEVDPCILNPCPSDLPICVRIATGGAQCQPCAATEAGCETPLAQGGNDTESGKTSSNNIGIVGGGVGGAVAALLLLFLLLLAICCCCRSCCCCCCAGVKEKESGVETVDCAQSNPLYFGVSTLVSSNGSSYKPPGYAQSSMDVDVRYNPGSTTSWPREETPDTTSEPHYEHIPAQFSNGSVDFEEAAAVTSGSYSHLLEKPKDVGAAQKPGQHDSPSKKSGRSENPYVMGPAPPGDSTYEMGAEARARRDMYTLLPSPEQLKDN